VKAEKVKSMDAKAADKAAEEAEVKAHREAAQKIATPKKPRRRSENIDPDMEA
ncbi:MAG: translation initiation factor, partial [Aeromicrobium sp.]|nr:translation initiation factor [Aeromicrobium sp.]